MKLRCVSVSVATNVSIAPVALMAAPMAVRRRKDAASV